MPFYLGLYRFPIIRYYIVDDTTYIGAIQSTQSKVDEAINKRVRRKLYKVNANIDNQNLLSVDPAVVCSLSMFLNYMSKYNINRVILLPYSLQRSNDKKLQLYHLKDIANDPESPYRARVCETIRKTSTYFERLPQIRSQLETSLLRVNYHYQKAAITIDNSQPGLLFGDLSECNNDLLSELGTAVNNKKTRL